MCAGDENRGRRLTTNAGRRFRQIKRLWLIKQGWWLLPQQLEVVVLSILPSRFQQTVEPSFWACKDLDDVKIPRTNNLLPTGSDLDLYCAWTKQIIQPRVDEQDKLFVVYKLKKVHLLSDISQNDLYMYFTMSWFLFKSRSAHPGTACSNLGDIICSILMSSNGKWSHFIDVPPRIINLAVIKPTGESVKQ